MNYKSIKKTENIDHCMRDGGNDPIQVVEIKDEHGVGYMSHDIKTILDNIKNSWDESDIGSIWTVNIKEIERHKYESLPEFEGF